MRTKKVISFSLWGNNPGYCQGALRNLERIPKHYPGWIPRFYVDRIVPEGVISSLTAFGAEIICMADQAGWEGLFWRFRPIFDDPTIERFIVRDTDSLINGREAACVQEWIESDLPFHIIRDHEQHNIHILGGTWGAVGGLIPDFEIEMATYISRYAPDPKNPRGGLHNADQLFLCQFVWPRIRKMHLAHDERNQFTGREQPFRVRLKRDGYVGMVYSEQDHDRTEVEG